MYTHQALDDLIEKASSFKKNKYSNLFDLFAIAFVVCIGSKLTDDFKRGHSSVLILAPK
jgi:hypothetical protein